MPFTIVRQDITQMEVDAVVNAANTDLTMGGGVCAAVFKAAGSAELQAACDKVSPIKTGEAAITPGFRLPAKYVIHAAGPVYCQGDTQNNEQLLRSAYLASLKVALANGCKSIAFPLISSGLYGYPKDEALQIATAAIKDFLTEHDTDVYLAVFDRDSFAVSEELLGAVESYIDDNYVLAQDNCHRTPPAAYQKKSALYTMPPCGSIALEDTATGLDDIIGRLDEPFNMALLRLIDAKGKTDAQVYKRANIDRKLFSKIRTGNGYMPGKRTIIALAVALELTLDETDDLLERAGYALSHSQKFDVIIEYFIVSGKYDVFEINQVLFKYDLPMLGAG